MPETWKGRAAVLMVVVEEDDDRRDAVLLADDENAAVREVRKDMMEGCFALFCWR